MPTRNRRRWFQYSLRTLLICSIVFAIACGMFVTRLKRKQKEREAVKYLQGEGWGVLYDYELDDNRAEPFGPASLRSLLGDDFFSEPRELNRSGLGDGHDADPDLARVADLTGVESLILTEAEVSQNGLARLKPLRSLRTLSLSLTTVTDEAMPVLASLSGLERLYLCGTPVGDAGVAQLANLYSLRTLDLRRTRITDAAVPYLQQMSKLRRLYVEETRVSQGGLARLRTSLPNCMITPIDDNHF